MTTNLITLTLTLGIAMLAQRSDAAIETKRLQPVPLTPGSEFGYAVAGQHPVWLLSAPGASGGQGQIHVFDCTDAVCQQSQTITGSGSTGFGRALALSNEWLAVGQPEVQRVSLYQRLAGTWVLHSTVQPTIPIVNGKFGSAVALDGTRLAVGAPGEGNGAGAVYIVDQIADQWVQQVRLDAPTVLRRLGHAMALDGDTLAVGAPYSAVPPGYAEGRVWVVRNVGGIWSEEALLASPVPASAELFGFAVDMQADRLVIGRPGASQSAVYDGAVDVFTRGNDSSWTLETTLSALSGSANERFGWSVGLDDEQIVVGSPFALANQTFLCGGSTLYVHAVGQWSTTADAVHDRLPGGLAGFSVALSSQRWMTGAPTFAESAGTGSGVGYWFDRVNGLFGHGFGLADISCLPEANRH